MKNRETILIDRTFPRNRSMRSMRSMRSALFAGAIFATWLMSGLASAQQGVTPQANPNPSPVGPAVGGRHQVVLDLFGGRSAIGGYYRLTIFGGALSMSSTKTERTDNRTRSTEKSTSVGPAPSLDVFVTDRLSVGGRASAAWLGSTAKFETAPESGPVTSYEGESSGYSLGIAPRVGYAIPLADTWALWPRVSVSMDVTRQQFENTSRAISRTLGAELNLGFVLRLGRHALFDFGPIVSYQATSTKGRMGSGVLGDPSPDVMPSQESSSLDGGLRASLGLTF